MDNTIGGALRKPGEMLQRASFSALFIATLIFATGCGSYVGGAKNAYSQGRYLEAAERLGQHEHEVSDLSPPSQAEYGMYRGLSLMKVADYPGAMRWLDFAFKVEQRHPGTLLPEQRRELEDGLMHCTRAIASEATVRRASLAEPMASERSDIGLDGSVGPAGPAGPMAPALASPPAPSPPRGP